MPQEKENLISAFKYKSTEEKNDFEFLIVLRNNKINFKTIFGQQKNY